jgi:glycosyltransferase involved in cell wall biosynthesis
LRPDISIIIPARNEGSRLTQTVASVAATRTTDARLEFIVQDDASSDDCATKLAHYADQIPRNSRFTIRIFRLNERAGVPRARNWGAFQASSDILVMTDAHVRFSHGWDAVVGQHIQTNRIFAGTVTQEGTDFHGYGCRLAIPEMGTYWNKEPFCDAAPVQIAASCATVLPRELFIRLGGYDSGMLIYGAAEPELSVRAWLCGAEILAIPDFLVEHHFKPKIERVSFLSQIGRHVLHNKLRFGLLYLSESASLQLIRYFTCRFPALAEDALRMVASSDVWSRRRVLEKKRRRTFEWFVESFGITDAAGREIL